MRASATTGTGEEAAPTGVVAFVRSKLFTHLFSGGMALVEETAGYLDDEGRRESRDLSREATLAYAGTSMRLTTRLMQIASWLLVLRAVREGEMSPAEARADKYRIGPPERQAERPDLAGLPPRLIELIERTDTLYARITRLDGDLFGDQEALSGEDAVGRLAALRAAFEPR